MRKFSCFIIGTSTLPIQCADILRQHQHQIQGIISSDPMVKQWADKIKIPCYRPSDNSLKWMAELSFDYLFSIVNDYVLPPETLSLPTHYAVNYHDAPLPVYAGMYATSWALINQEKEHGITWHIMTEKIDAGDILKQKLVDITPADTALTLNTKCYEAAIDAFRELVLDLNHNQVIPIPQDLNQRTYFSLYKRPNQGGVISWKQQAEQIDALVRALTFGSYPNYLGMPKLAIQQTLVIVTKVNLLSTNSTALPGTIIEIDDAGFTISTTTKDILIQELLTIDGFPLSIDKLLSQYGLQIGDRLSELEPHIVDYLSTHYQKICKHEKFWLTRLKTFEPLHLPYLENSRTDSYDDTISLKTTIITIPDKVVNFAAQQQWFLSNFLLSAFITYLARLSDTDTFDIGFDIKTITSFSIPDNFFATQLPLQIELNPDHTFIQVHETVQTQLNHNLQHVSYSRDITSRYPQLETIPSFPIIIAYGNDYQPPISTDFTCLISTTDSEIRWLYRPNHLTQATINQMVNQFIYFLHGLTKQPETPLWKISLLRQAELHQLLVEPNRTQLEYPSKLIHQLFEEQADQFPNHIAVVYENNQLTYAQLHQQSNQLAHYLKMLGVGPKTLVGLCIKPSLKVMVGLLGILKAGAAYLPLDPLYPVERLNFMVENSDLPFLITEQQLTEQFQQTGTQLIAIDSDWNMIVDQPIDTPINQNSLDDLAYVIYTSGSTGQPKGSMVIHRGLTNYLCWAKHAYKVDNGQGAPVHSSISFDLTITSLFLPLLVGRTVTLLATYQGSEALSHTLRTNKEFSLIKITPAHLDMLSQLLHPEDIGGRVQRLVIGGEALRTDHLRFWQQHVPETTLINEYGPTETVVGCCVYEVPPNRVFDDTVPIGRPIANTQLYVLNRHRQPVPMGVPGELYIGGHGVARGYLNLPTSTTEKFIPISACNFPIRLQLDEHSQRLYKTGDIVRYLPDGNLEFLGRSDNQVKIRGYRIELDEIISVLNQHPYVDEAVVLVQDEPNKAKQLDAYLVLNNQANSSISITDHQHLTAIQAFLQAKLPEYMVPSTFTIIKSIPLTLNGKVDYQTLITFNRNITYIDSKNHYVAPRNATEKKLVTIWQMVLGLEQVGVEDNFFNLGGHSLLATQIISQIRDDFQVEIPLRSLFEGPTIVDLTQHIETLRWIKQTALEMLASEYPKGIIMEREEDEL